MFDMFDSIAQGAGGSAALRHPGRRAGAWQIIRDDHQQGGRVDDENVAKVMVLPLDQNSATRRQTMDQAGAFTLNRTESAPFRPVVNGLRMVLPVDGDSIVEHPTRVSLTCHVVPLAPETGLDDAGPAASDQRQEPVWLLKASDKPRGVA